MIQWTDRYKLYPICLKNAGITMMRFTTRCSSKHKVHTGFAAIENAFNNPVGRLKEIENSGFSYF